MISAPEPHVVIGPEKLIRMAVEIANFFRNYPEERAVEGIATHINKFWTPEHARGIPGGQRRARTSPVTFFDGGAGEDQTQEIRISGKINILGRRR